MNRTIYQNRESKQVYQKGDENSPGHKSESVHNAEVFIPLKDRIVLGPIDRYKKYGYFPWKFVNHMMLTILTSIQILFIVNGELDYSQYTIRNLYTSFMTFGGTTADTGESLKLYNIAEV